VNPRSRTVREHIHRMRDLAAGELRQIEETATAREMAQPLPEPGMLPVAYVDTRPAFAEGMLVAQFCNGAEIVTQRALPATPETIATLSAWAQAAGAEFHQPA
jgi:hypothetical protein